MMVEITSNEWSCARRACRRYAVGRDLRTREVSDTVLASQAFAVFVDRGQPPLREMSFM